jgi:glutaredoxin
MAIRLTIYSRPGCHLCEIMTAMVRHVGRTVSLSLDEIDITSDAALMARYETAIPVLAIGDREIARYRIGEVDLRKALAQFEVDDAG